MANSEEKDQSRRNFISNGARILTFGALGGYALTQTVKRQRLEGDPHCVKLPTCYTCLEFSGCELDKASKARTAFPGDNKQ